MDSRFLSLDVVRGVAVMGILLMNIVALGMPLTAYFNPFAYGGDTPLDTAVWAVNFILVDGKMRGLFSVLFGASMLLVIERAEAKSQNPGFTHYSRMSWLLFFGFVHAYFIWQGDILMLYAVVGAVAFLFRKLSTERLMALGLVFLLVQFMFLAFATFSMWSLREAAMTPGVDAELALQWAEVSQQFSTMPAGKLAQDISIFRGDYAGIVAERLGPRFWDPIIANLLAAPETLGFMLLGMAGLKSGFLKGEFQRAAYARYARIGYLIGLPALTVIAILVMRSGFEPVAVFGVNFTMKVLFNPFVILAHAALILYCVQSSPGSALIARIGATGRAAFTNYLGTSIVCTTIFYGYGFGLYGELSRAALYIVVLGVWLLMLLWSKPWLDRFRYGPLEWLWRTLARREIQAIRK